MDFSESAVTRKESSVSFCSVLLVAGGYGQEFIAKSETLRPLGDCICCLFLMVLVLCILFV